MNGIAKKLEVMANVAIIGVAIMVGAVLVQRHFAPSKAEEAPTIPIGKKLSLPNVDWSKNSQTLVLALQTGCHYCSESAPFYQRLASEMSTRKIPVVAVLPQTIQDGQTYLSKLKVPIEDIKQATLNSIGVRGTPAILLVDNKGEVKAGWLGKLQPVKEAEVLSSIR